MNQLASILQLFPGMNAFICPSTLNVASETGDLLATLSLVGLGNWLRDQIAAEPGSAVASPDPSDE